MLQKLVKHFFLKYLTMAPESRHEDSKNRRNGEMRGMRSEVRLYVGLMIRTSESRTPGTFPETRVIRLIFNCRRHFTDFITARPLWLHEFCSSSSLHSSMISSGAIFLFGRHSEVYFVPGNRNWASKSEVTRALEHRSYIKA